MGGAEPTASGAVSNRASERAGILTVAEDKGNLLSGGPQQVLVTPTEACLNCSSQSFGAARTGAASSRQQAKDTSAVVSTHCPSLCRCARPSAARMARYFLALPGWSCITFASSSALAEPQSLRSWTTSSVRGAGNGFPRPCDVRAAQASTSEAVTRQKPSLSFCPVNLPNTHASRTAVPLRPTRRPAAVVLSISSSRANGMCVVSRRVTRVSWI